MKNKSSLFAFMFLVTSLATMNVKAQKMNLIIGTYTTNTKSEGIYVYEFDEQACKATYKNKATGVEDPSYLAISDNGKFVYAANEAGEGKVSSFSFDPASGALKLLNTQPARGSAPCYIAINRRSNHVFAANYGGGNFSVYPVMPDGSLGDSVKTINYEGSSANKSRQEKPHVHSTIFSPEESLMLVSDLGTDKIHVYQYHAKNTTEPLTPASKPFISVEPGSGPRHLAFHPNGTFMYSIQELNGNVIAFQREGDIFRQLQSISMLAPGFEGATGAADIHVSPDGKFLYASNRGDANDIVIFSIDKKGILKYAGRQSSLGKGPRNFVIHPSGDFLLVGNQYTDEVVIFNRDRVSGMLSDTGERIKVAAPVCLKFSK